MRWPGTVKNMRATPAPITATATVAMAVAAVQYRPVSRATAVEAITATIAARKACGAPGCAPGGAVAAAATRAITPAHVVAPVAKRSPLSRGLSIAATASTR